MDSVRLLWSAGGTGVLTPAIPATPDPRYRFMRVEVDGHPPGLLVLGYVDATPSGPVEVWYSGGQEALRLQDGRLVGATGTRYAWRAVQWQPTPPAWGLLGAQGAHYTRQRDAMPGYHYGLQEAMQVQPWAGLPPIALVDSLPADKARSYQWFQETASPQGPGPALPPAWFARGRHLGVDTIVYSEQCLAPDFCLKLQRWPLRDEAP